MKNYQARITIQIKWAQLTPSAQQVVKNYTSPQKEFQHKVIKASAIRTEE